MPRGERVGELADRAVEHFEMIRYVVRGGVARPQLGPQRLPVAGRAQLEYVPNWYGVSADTAQRGLSSLRSRNLLDVDIHVKTAPLSATGATTEHRYIVTASVVLEWSNMRHRVAGVVGERISPFHYRREGPEAIERMATVLEEAEVVASVLWRPVARRGQVAARRDLLAAHARRLARDGVTHLIIESGDATSDQRDQETLLDVFAADGGVPFRYDWRSKAEPLLWIADAICGVTAEHLLGNCNTIFDRLANAGIIEVANG